MWVAGGLQLKREERVAGEGGDAIPHSVKLPCPVSLNLVRCFPVSGISTAIYKVAASACCQARFPHRLIRLGFVEPKLNEAVSERACTVAS